MDRKLLNRVERVERESFVTLYSAAAAWNTGWLVQDGVTVFWSGDDDDPSFSCILDLSRSTRPEATVQEIERVARDRGALVLGIDTHPYLEAWATEERLAQLGFLRDSQECIWTRPLPGPLEGPAPSQAVQIERAGATDRELFARILNLGWSLPEDAARGHVFAAGIDLPDWYQYIAYMDDEPAGVAVLFVHDRVADCFLSATLPGYRARGVQTALIHRRLTDAIEIGCDLATSQTVVDNASPRNMARQGFQPLFRRWIYGKQLRP